jgi:hypothetical protein
LHLQKRYTQKVNVAAQLVTPVPVPTPFPRSAAGAYHGIVYVRITQYIVKYMHCHLASTACIVLGAGIEGNRNCTNGPSSSAAAVDVS